MRAGFCCLALALLVVVGSVQGQEIKFIPVQTTGNLVCLPGGAGCTGNQVKLSAGGVNVRLHIGVTGWPGLLGAYQSAIDATTYEGALAAGVAHAAHPGNPGTILGCNLEAEGYAESNCAAGNFIAEKVCQADFTNPATIDYLTICATAAECTGGMLKACVDRPDYVFVGKGATQAISCATIDYTTGAATVSCQDVNTPPAGSPMSPYWYGGTLILSVPPCAKGTYNVDFVNDVNFTMFNDCTGVLIPGLTMTPVAITIVTGSCCYGIGTPSAGCVEDVTAAECALMAPPYQFRAGVDCDVECCECLNNAQCNDGNACTTDTCVSCVCYNDPNYEVGIECCNPANGAVQIIDDGNLCTDDGCNETTGVPTHTNNTDPCDDDNGCTINDTCGDGACAGDDVNEIACDDAADCNFPGQGSWPCVEGFCECLLATPLVFEVDPGMLPDPNCFEVGDDVLITAQMLAGSEVVVGAQLFMEYDPSCLDFVSIGPCDGSVFDINPIVEINEVAGTIFYVTHIQPYKACDAAADNTGELCDADADCPNGACVFTDGTKGPADLACMVFTKLDGCDECNICYGGENPYNTRLSNDEGNMVDYAAECSKMVRINGDLDLSDMGDFEVNPDCPYPYAQVAWDTPVATDTCGEAQLVCTGAFAHNVGEPAPSQGIIDALVMNGGTFTQGQWFFQCTATNDCGDTMQEVWTVKVSDKHSLDVEVHVSDLLPGNVERCICFELYDEACNAAVVECTEMLFGPPYNFKGHATGSLKIDKYNWGCIAAVDPYHTLRGEGDLACVNKVWKATWKGDPLLGGNWLQSGNLDYFKGEANSPNVIDVLDFGHFILSIRNGGVDSADTECGMAGPHGDLNGDGVVDNLDYAIIQGHFLASSKDVCCPDGPGTFDSPVTEISVKQLRTLGLGDLTVADLNRDGMVNAADMAAYEAGEQPTVIKKNRR